ncbi:MAG: MaoC family dehydratase N-terminal domain-containing protein [Hyphomicrobiaceae bacterium]
MNQVATQPVAEVIDMAHLKQWIGKTEQRSEVLAPFPANGLAGTLDRMDAPYAAGSELPPMWHLVYGLGTPPMSGLGADGHAKRGGFLPPVPLPRRMWAGGRLRFLKSLIIGKEMTRTGEVLNVEVKNGRTGSMVFVTVRFTLADAEGVALTEERDIVYREMPSPRAPAVAAKIAPTDQAWSRTIHPDPVLLFRYSALTYNGHRIHFDRDFCKEHEGYPGLVVHGPMLATMLVDLVRRQIPNAVIKSFDFRAVSPVFDTASFDICGKPSPDGGSVHLWVRKEDGGLAMEGTATIA